MENKVPEAISSSKYFCSSECFTEPSVVMPIPKNKMPIQAAQKTIFLLYMNDIFSAINFFQSQISGTKNTCISCQSRTFKTYFFYADRLCPLSRFIFYSRDQRNSRTKNAATKNDHFRIEQTHQIASSHSPKFIAVLNNLHR